MTEVALSEENARRVQQLLNNVEPKHCTFASIAEDLAVPKGGQPLIDTLLSILARLKYLSSTLEDTASASQTQDETPALDQLLSKFTALLQSELAQEFRKNKDAKADEHALVTESALASLDILFTHWRREPEGSSLLLALTAFTNSSDPWTTFAAATIASNHLEKQLPGQKLDAFIVQTVLQGHLRPIFSKSTSKVTASGRPAHFQDPTPNQRTGLDPPSWKQYGPKVVTTFQWAVKHSNESLLRDNWPLYTPVLLALAEDDETPTRRAGLLILHDFLQRCPAKILQSTGIGMVFQDAMFPSLLHLPSLTPEKESMPLLEAAYDSLLVLATKDPDVQSLPRRKLLDKLLREGVLAGHTHASEYIGIVEVLMRKTASIINALGIYAAKHIQMLLSIISTVMTDPFALLRPSAVLAASEALIALIANCWPRFTDDSREGEIVRIISICWVNLHEGENTPAPASDDLQKLGEKLKSIAKMMQAIRKAQGTTLSADLAGVIGREACLAELFTEGVSAED